MSFMLYEVTASARAERLRFTGEHYALAGHNILRRLWEAKERPLNQGWHVSANDMVAHATLGQHTVETRRLLVDASPHTTGKVEVIEILDVWAFTLGDRRTHRVWWTPLMLNVGGVLSRQDTSGMTTDKRQALIEDIHAPRYSDECREFLFLLGDDRCWSWGMSGRTNAPYLEPQVRAYFRSHF